MLEQAEKVGMVFSHYPVQGLVNIHAFIYLFFEIFKNKLVSFIVFKKQVTWEEILVAVEEDSLDYDGSGTQIEW